MTRASEQPKKRAVPRSCRDLEDDDIRFCTEEPKQPEVGTHWYDLESRCLCVWDGDSWEPVHCD
jgi:hypothetical protein